jgi:2-oxoglutarate dehydrogenase E1 component
VAWCQEEPQNQGAWYQIRHQLQKCAGKEHKLFYCGRKGSSSPAVGYYKIHIEEQNLLVATALKPGDGELQ